MSILQEHAAVVQHTAKAIAKVISMEVEVIDDGGIRIAGTGKYATGCGRKNASFVYEHVMKTGVLSFIDCPGEHALCEPCPFYHDCPEDAELAAPIMVEGKAVGVIGLVSFSKEQTSYFLDYKEWMIQFLEKMAELIASAVRGNSMPEEPQMLNLHILEKQAIEKALKIVASEPRKVDKAATLLGISRATLYRKLKEYHLQ